MTADPAVSSPGLDSTEPAAVIVVDVQNDFCHGDGALGRGGARVDLIQAAVRRISAFIDAAREVGLPIIFIRTEHGEWTNSQSWVRRLQDFDVQRSPICQEGSWGAEFYEVAPTARDRVVVKHRYSAFIDTDLDVVLRSRQIRTLIMTGITTNVCVESTARDGFMKDYRIVLVDDCCAARSPEEHEASLSNIRKHFGIVASAAEVLAAWSPSREIKSVGSAAH